MKSTSTLFLFLSIIFSAFSQFQKPQWEMPIYFEDDVGAKDTIWFGYDERASFFRNEVDTIFDEDYKWIDTSKFVVYFGNLKLDSALKRNITSFFQGYPEIYLSVNFLNGKLPLKVYWDSKLLNHDSLPFPDQSPRHKAKMWVGHVPVSANYFVDPQLDSILDECCFHCFFVNVSDSTYQGEDGECQTIPDTLYISSKDNDFYTAETGVGGFGGKVVPIDAKLNVGVEELDHKDISIFPNPFLNEITIKKGNSILNEVINIKIMNTHGQIVSQFRIDKNQESIIKDLIQLHGGVYYIISESLKRRDTKVLIKTN